MESSVSLLSSSEPTHRTLHNSAPKSSPSSLNRLWRPAAQRNMKNQWSKLNSLRQEWASSSSTARSHATSLVNAYLSQSLCISIRVFSFRFMKDVELGVLSDMPDIKKKACRKLLKQQVVHRDNLVSSYKEMVATLVNMVNTSMSLRCFHKGETNSPLIQFSNSCNDTNDNGDGGGIPVFIFSSISYFEKLAWELLQMFKLELNLKRLLVIEFLSLRNREDSVNERLCWSDEVYEGEFDDLSRCRLDIREVFDSDPRKFDGLISENININIKQPNCQLDSDVLQIYLTAWLTDVSIDKQRVEDIFCEVGEEMHVKFGS